MINYTDSDDTFISLLTELESTQDHTRLAEEVFAREQHIEKIEDITGPSKRTNKLHKEIESLKKLSKKMKKGKSRGRVDIYLSS